MNNAEYIEALRAKLLEIARDPYYGKRILIRLDAIEALCEMEPEASPPTVYHHHTSPVVFPPRGVKS